MVKNLTFNSQNGLFLTVNAVSAPLTPQLRPSLARNSQSHNWTALYLIFQNAESIFWAWSRTKTLAQVHYRIREQTRHFYQCNLLDDYKKKYDL